VRGLRLELLGKEARNFIPAQLLEEGSTPREEHLMLVTGFMMFNAVLNAGGKPVTPSI